jgi:hypothetical protein
VTGLTTLALEDPMFAADDPAIRERLADGARDLAPTAWLDQLAAATRDVEADMERFAAAPGLAARTSRARDVPGWVRLGLASAIVTWAAGTAKTCLHAPHPSRPQPVHVAAWRPALIVCAGCTHLLAIPRGSARDRTCDGCGHITTGPEHSDRIRPGAVQCGEVTYPIGACEQCAWTGREVVTS